MACRIALFLSLFLSIPSCSNRASSESEKSLSSESTEPAQTKSKGQEWRRLDTVVDNQKVYMLISPIASLSRAKGKVSLFIMRIPNGVEYACFSFSKSPTLDEKKRFRVRMAVSPPSDLQTSVDRVVSLSRLPAPASEGNPNHIDYCALEWADVDWIMEKLESSHYETLTLGWFFSQQDQQDRSPVVAVIKLKNVNHELEKLHRDAVAKK